MITDEKLRLKI